MEWKGVVWGFFWSRATGWRFCRKSQKEPAKCLYSDVYCVTVYSFPPAISVSTCQQLRLGQIVWFGWLSGVGKLCLHSVREEGCVPSPWPFRTGVFSTCSVRASKGRRQRISSIQMVCLSCWPDLCSHCPKKTLTINVIKITCRLYCCGYIYILTSCFWQG